MTIDLDKILLRTIVCATDDMFNAPIDPGHPEWHRTVEANVAAWTAYRLLQALREADPAKADKTIAELENELDDGDYSITACQDAMHLGHSTEQWMADHQKWRAELPAKWANRHSRAATTINN